jgi:hypothetical protein
MWMEKIKHATAQCLHTCRKEGRAQGPRHQKFKSRVALRIRFCGRPVGGRNAFAMAMVSECLALCGCFYGTRWVTTTASWDVQWRPKSVKDLVHAVGRTFYSDEHVVIMDALCEQQFLRVSWPPLFGSVVGHGCLAHLSRPAVGWAV